MRPTSFDPSVLRQHLRRHKIADLSQLKRILGTKTDLTVFRKLQQLDYLASYTHRGRFYTLADIAHFDDQFDDILALVTFTVWGAFPGTSGETDHNGTALNLSIN